MLKITPPFIKCYAPGVFYSINTVFKSKYNPATININTIHKSPFIRIYLGSKEWDIIGNSREPGLVDRVLALYRGSRGFDPTGGTCLNDFSDPIDQDIRTWWALSWLVIAVSLNVGGGVRLIKLAKLYTCMQNITNTPRTDAWCQVFRTPEPLGERRFQNWNTHTHKGHHHQWIVSYGDQREGTCIHGSRLMSSCALDSFVIATIGPWLQHP